MANSSYPERLCAYLDILGFRGYVASLRDDASKVVALKNTLDMVHRPAQLGIADRSTLEYRAQSISDAVAMSVVPSPAGLIELFLTIEFLALALLASGYFLRGAITRGRLYHDDTTVFGQALIQAYDLEQTVVRYLWPGFGLLILDSTGTRIGIHVGIRNTGRTAGIVKTMHFALVSKEDWDAKKIITYDVYDGREDVIAPDPNIEVRSGVWHRLNIMPKISCGWITYIDVFEKEWS